MLRTTTSNRPQSLTISISTRFQKANNFEKQTILIPTMVTTNEGARHMVTHPAPVVARGRRVKGGEGANSNNKHEQ